MAAVDSPPTQKEAYARIESMLHYLVYPAITAVLGIALGYWLTSGAPLLVYSVDPIAQFKGDKETFGLFAVTVMNDGSKMAEDLVCRISFNGCEIRDIRTDPPDLEPTITSESGTARIQLPYLNPSTALKITLVTNPCLDGSADDVTVRAKGIAKGVLRQPESHSMPWGSVVSSIVSLVLSGCTVFLVINAWRRFAGQLDSMSSQTIDTLQTFANESHAHA